TMVKVRFPLCVVCNEEVNFHQHALCCDNCSRWQHRLCDSGITYKDYRCLAQEEIEIIWHCAACPGANSRQATNIATKDIAPISRNENKIELNDLPAGWIKRTERKSMGLNGKQNIYYISPNGRKFRSKKQALEFSALHYQELSPVTSTKADLKEKSISKIILSKGKDMNLQPYIPLHRLNNNFDKIRNFQPFVNLQRLSSFTISRETNQIKSDEQLNGISDVNRREFSVKDETLSRNKANVNCETDFEMEENINKITHIKKKHQKLNIRKVKKHQKIETKELKINKNKSPVKIKAQLKKHSMNISLKINRNSLQIHPNNKIQLINNSIHNPNLSEKKWNLKLGTVKVKNKVKNKMVKNGILKNTELCDDDCEYENSVGKMILSAENSKQCKPYIKPLIWLHISPKDIEFGLIS
ncbi:unnamed protein product, partial [Meganyctiphanes norvegica]